MSNYHDGQRFMAENPPGYNPVPITEPTRPEPIPSEPTLALRKATDYRMRRMELERQIAAFKGAEQVMIGLEKMQASDHTVKDVLAAISHLIP